MRIPSLADTVVYAKRRYSRLAKWPYLVAAAVIVVAGRLLNAWLTSPETEAAIGEALQAIAGLNPLSMIGAFFDSFLACNRFEAGGEEYVNCSAWRYVDPRRVLAAVFGMAAAVWEEGSGLARIMLVTSLAFAVPVSAAATSSIKNRLSKFPSDFGMGDILAIAVLVPFIASFTGLVLQAVAWLLVFLLGMLAGIIGFFLVQFAVAIEWFRMLRDVEEHAKTLEKFNEPHNKPPPPG